MPGLNPAIRAVTIRATEKVTPAEPIPVLSGEELAGEALVEVVHDDALPSRSQLPGPVRAARSSRL